MWFIALPSFNMPLSTTLSIPTHTSKATSRKSSLILLTLFNLYLLISNSKHSLDITMCSLSLVTDALCLYSKSLQVDWASFAGKNDTFYPTPPKTHTHEHTPVPGSLLSEPKDIGYPQTKLLRLSHSECSTLAGMGSALSIKPKSCPHPIGFPKLPLTWLSFSHRTQNPPRRPGWMLTPALQLIALILFRYK